MMKIRATQRLKGREVKRREVKGGKHHNVRARCNQKLSRTGEEEAVIKEKMLPLRNRGMSV